MSGCIAVIPAKGTSSRIPNKNRKPFHGKPIIEYSIDTAKSAGLFASILVSTDDADIADIAIAKGVVAVYRDKRLLTDDTGTQEVALQTAAVFRPDYVCCIYATAPMMTGADLRRGYDAVQRANFAFSVGDEPLRDAGQFYWSHMQALLDRRPLFGERTVMISIPSSRVCDINDESDWSRAEAMYAALHA